VINFQGFTRNLQTGEKVGVHGKIFFTKHHNTARQTKIKNQNKSISPPYGPKKYLYLVENLRFIQFVWF